jgi:hypothetical protein
MTPEHIDEARAREAVRVTLGDLSWDCWGVDARVAIILAARYGREGFVPVDPDLVEAREICANLCNLTGERYRSGELDDTGFVRIALAALKRGKELAGGQP